MQEEEGESEFVKTDCYHYFHTGCLLRYISHHQRVSAEEEEEGRRELECPVCRKTLPDGETESVGLSRKLCECLNLQTA